MKKYIIALFCFSYFAAIGQEENISGFYHRSSLGILAGTQSNLTVSTANGYRLKNGWENGIGFGVERYYNMFTSPIFVESRMNFLKNKLQTTEFFAGIMGGYQAVLGSNRNGEGRTAGFSIGMTHYLNNHSALYTSLGYRYVWLKEKTNYPYYYYDFAYLPYPGYFETSEMHRIELRVGFRFH